MALPIYIYIIVVKNELSYGYDEMYVLTKKIKIKHNAYILNRATAVFSTG